MKKAVTLVLALLTATAAQAQQRPLKVFISVDMEGLSGVVTGPDVSRTAANADYAHFRSVMALETNAAIDGAFRAGATDVLVRDSHGSKQNLLPLDVDPRARLFRGATTGPRNMMEGIDSTFAAAVFVGYHARAGTPNAILAHTSNSNVIDFSINGVSLPEGGYNALVAGLSGVPVVFVAGDLAVVNQLRELLGNIEAVAVKEAVNGGINGMSPKSAADAIREGVERAVRNRSAAKPYKLSAPYTMRLKVRRENGATFPGAMRVAAGEYEYKSNNLLDVLDAFNALK